MASCKAITKAGTRCKNQGKYAGYCGRHGVDPSPAGRGHSAKKYAVGTTMVGLDSHMWKVSRSKTWVRVSARSLKFR